VLIILLNPRTSFTYGEVIGDMGMLYFLLWLLLRYNYLLLFFMELGMSLQSAASACLSFSLRPGDHLLY